MVHIPSNSGACRSSTAQYYAIKDIEEAIEFLNDPYLGDNLRVISKELLRSRAGKAVGTE